MYKDMYIEKLRKRQEELKVIIEKGFYGMNDYIEYLQNAKHINDYDELNEKYEKLRYLEKEDIIETSNRNKLRKLSESEIEKISDFLDLED